MYSYSLPSLTDDLEQLAVLVVLENSPIAIAVRHEERAGGLRDHDRRRLAEVLVIVAGHKRLAQNQVWLVRVCRELRLLKVTFSIPSSGRT